MKTEFFNWRPTGMAVAKREQFGPMQYVRAIDFERTIEVLGDLVKSAQWAADNLQVPANSNYMENVRAAQKLLAQLSV